MKKIMVISSVFLLVLVLLAGCENTKNRPSILDRSSGAFSVKTVNLDIGITIGNHTYLPINIGWFPADNAREILQILDIFEKKHPELEITSWHIEERQAGYAFNQNPYVWGIWINHRLR